MAQGRAWPPRGCAGEGDDAASGSPDPAAAVSSVWQESGRAVPELAAT